MEDMHDKNKFFVGGLPQSTQQIHVTNYFSNYGQVVNANIRFNPVGQCMGYGFIEMANKQIVERILTGGPHYLIGQKIDVKPFMKVNDVLRVFVGGLDPQTTNESLQQYFSQFGLIVDGSIRIDASTGRGRGFAILTFADEASVNAAVSMEKHLLDGKVVEVKRIDKSASKGRSGPSNENSSNNLFIGGLSPQTTRETLKDYYSQFGPVVECNVATDKATGKRRGFGFVRFDDAASVTRCMTGRPHTVDGKAVETKRVLSRDDAKNMFTVSKLFVGALKVCHNENNLRTYFSQFGNVVNVKMTPRNDGSEGHRGFAFVTFDDYDAVDQVILQRNHAINGGPVDCHKGLNKDEMAKLQLQIERDRLTRERGAAVPFGGLAAAATYYTNEINDYTMRDVTAKQPGGAHVKPVMIHVRGDAFRQLLMSTECSGPGIATLTTENLLDSAVLLSLTPNEFDALPLSVGDKKRIEIALRSLHATPGT